MGLFGFDKLSFVAGLGITLLLCGLIMFYVKQKFSVYDRTIMEQSQLLKHLVSSIQMNSSSLAANGAVESARKAHDLFGDETNTKIINRIVVSDDEDDDGDEDDDASSDSETVSDSDDNDDSDDSDDSDDDEESNVNMISKLNTLEDEKLNIKVVNVDDLNILNNAELLSEEQSTSLKINKEKDTYQEENQMINDENDENDENDINENVDNTEKKWILENDNLENIKEKSKYVELNKSQLQELCKERNLSIKGSKKDLIDRLIE